MPGSPAKSPKKSKSPKRSSSAGKKRSSKSKSSRKSSGPKKHSYVQMIQSALMSLNERGGTSRQEMWKFIQAKFPEADYKMFLVRLKKYAGSGGFVE